MLFSRSCGISTALSHPCPYHPFSNSLATILCKCWKGSQQAGSNRFLFFVHRESKLASIDAMLLDPSSSVGVQLLAALIQLPQTMAKKFQSVKKWSEALSFIEKSEKSSKESTPDLDQAREGTRTPREVERKTAASMLW